MSFLVIFTSVVYGNSFHVLCFLKPCLLSEKLNLQNSFALIFGENLISFHSFHINEYSALFLYHFVSEYNETERENVFFYQNLSLSFLLQFL